MRTQHACMGGTRPDALVPPPAQHGPPLHRSSPPPAGAAPHLHLPPAPTSRSAPLPAPSNHFDLLPELVHQRCPCTSSPRPHRTPSTALCPLPLSRQPHLDLLPELVHQRAVARCLQVRLHLGQLRVLGSQLATQLQQILFVVGLARSPRRGLHEGAGRLLLLGRRQLRRHGVKCFEQRGQGAARRAHELGRDALRWVAGRVAWGGRRGEARGAPELRGVAPGAWDRQPVRRSRP